MVLDYLARKSSWVFCYCTDIQGHQAAGPNVPPMLCSLIIQGYFFQLSGSTRSFKGAIVINFVFGVATQKQGKSLLVASQIRWSLPL